jgi:hypothetical protein
LGRIFERAEQYLDRLSPGEFVEIGTSRVGDGHRRINGDGGSTVILAGWADRCGQTLHAVDIDPEQINLVESFAIKNVETHCQTGEDYFYHRIYSIRPVSLLHLDNFDWDWHPDRTEEFVVEQQKRYANFGLTMTNVNSQSAHLMQMIYALPHMAEHCLVVCDDTWYNKWWGHYSGKSGAVVPYLLANGFTVLETEEEPVYGTILGRGIQ